MVNGSSKTRLNRTTITTSRLMDYCSEKELTAQTGHSRQDWPLVILKELTDNALDGCEEGAIPPEIQIEVTNNSITVADNGPGIPPGTIEKVLHFSVRVSSREAYVAPDRGAQGNASKTVLMMPFVLDGKMGQIQMETKGVRHTINVQVDQIRQGLVLDHQQEKTPEPVRNGTTVKVVWPDSACSILADAKQRFLQIADDYTFLNPHLTLHLNWMGEKTHIAATDRNWAKWRPDEPTSIHWYRPEDLARLVAAYIADDRDTGRDRTVREFVAEFRGLSSTVKQKRVLQATGLSRINLSVLANHHDIDQRRVQSLLTAMRENTKPVKPNSLGIIDRDNLAAKFERVGCEMESFQYRRIAKEKEDGLPFLLETAFGWCERLPRRRLVLGVNWSPGIINPFRRLGSMGDSLDGILEQQRVGRNEPVVFLLHCACPRVEYTDRGKSAVVVKGGEDEQ